MVIVNKVKQLQEQQVVQVPYKYVPHVQSLQPCFASHLTLL
jgi:hypothetical protein